MGITKINNNTYPIRIKEIRAEIHEVTRREDTKFNLRRLEELELELNSLLTNVKRDKREIMQNNKYEMKDLIIKSPSSSYVKGKEAASKAKSSLNKLNKLL